MITFIIGFLSLLLWSMSFAYPLTGFNGAGFYIVSAIFMMSAITLYTLFGLQWNEEKAFTLRFYVFNPLLSTVYLVFCFLENLKEPLNWGLWGLLFAFWFFIYAIFMSCICPKTLKEKNNE